MDLNFSNLLKDLKTNKSRWDENKSKRFAGLNPSKLTLIRSRIRIVLVSTLKTTRSRSHIASVNIIPRIVDPTVVPTLDLDLGQAKPKPGPSPIMSFSSVYQLEKCDHITQSDTAQTLPNRNLHQLKVRLHVPATKFSSTTRNLPKTDDSLCRLPTVYPRPPLTITVDKRRNK